MKIKDIKYYLTEWTKLNFSYIRQIKKNIYYKKKKIIQFNNEFLSTIKQDSSPLFVLSTGRCGTEYLTKILTLNNQIDAYHSPNPELYIASKYAYENYSEKNEELCKIIESARLELIIESFLRDRYFVETNNKVTFFAYAINEVFPKSKFIHLVRHPGSFVRSGIRRNWYHKKDKHDLGRIVPKKPQYDFNHLSDVEKIGWLWNETNKFIDDFKDTVKDENRILTLKAEDLFGNKEIAYSLYDFIGCDGVSGSKLNSVLNKKINVQTNNDFPKYENWNTDERAKLKLMCPIAEKYNYSL